MSPIINEGDMAHPLHHNESAEYKAELIYQKNLLFFIIDYLPVGVVTKDCKNDFKYIIWNKKMEEFYGISWRDAVGKNDRDLQPTLKFATEIENEDLAMVTNDLSSKKYMIELTLQGKHYKFLKHKILFKDKSGEPDLIVTVLQDMTNEEAMESLSNALISSVAGEIIDRNRNFILNKTSGKLPIIINGKIVPEQKS